MKLQLKPLASDIFICIYAIASLYLRFKFEHNETVDPISSIATGAGFVVIIWALIKLKVLNPNWFGLFSTSKNQVS